MTQTTTPYGSFLVSTNIFIPEEDKQDKIRITEYFRDHAEAINRRVICTYDPTVSQTGQQWPAAAGQNIQRRRIASRVIVPITIDSSGAPNTNSFPHGLTPNGYTFTLITGVIGNGSNSWVPLPTPGTDETLVSVDATHVNITNATSAYNGYTGYIVLEFLTN